VRDELIGKGAGPAPAYAAEEVRGWVHELLQSPAWSREKTMMGRSLGNFAEDEACSLIQGKVRCS
jgi:hypothetical protein